MPVVSVASIPQLIAVAGAVTLLATFIALPALPQSISATAKSVPTGTMDPAAMKRRIDDLERRVLELEKEKLEQAEVEEAEASSDKVAEKKLEQRLAAIEAQQREDAAAEKSSSPGTSSTSGVVRAPFVVVDSAGKRMLTVERSKNGSATLIVGDGSGAHVRLSVAAGGESAIRMINPAGDIRMQADVSAERTYVGVFGKQGFSALVNEADGIPVVQVSNKSRVPVVELRGMLSEAGQITIRNAGGEPVVVAGVAKGVGVVKTGPKGNGVAVQLGNAGLPASEIQGRVK